MKMESLLIDKTNNYFEDKKSYRKIIKKVVDSYFKYCNYDVDTMTSQTYNRYVCDKKIVFFDAYHARGIVRNILISNCNISTDFWPGRNVAEIILKDCDMEFETKKYIKIDDWKEFQGYAEELFLIQKNKKYTKNYINVCFAWNGINPCLHSKIKKSFLKIHENSVSIDLDMINKKYEIEDKILVWCLNNLEEDDEFFLKNKIRSKRVLNVEMANIFMRDIQDIYYSGVAYQMTNGFVPNISKNNGYLMPYFKAISEYMYGKTGKE